MTLIASHESAEGPGSGGDKADRGGHNVAVPQNPMPMNRFHDTSTGNPHQVPPGARLQGQICRYVCNPADGGPVWQAGAQGRVMQVHWETVPEQAPTPGGALPGTAAGTGRAIRGRCGSWFSAADWVP
jgi:hypothetical protein